MYAALWEAGVAIYETTAVGVKETSLRARQGMKLLPTVVRGEAWRHLTDGLVVFDAMGRRVTQAKPGVYFVMEAQAQAQAQAIRKVVLVE